MNYCKYCMDFEEGSGESSVTIIDCASTEAMDIGLDLTIDGNETVPIETEYEITHGASLGLFAYDDGDESASLSLGLMLNNCYGATNLRGNLEIKVRYCPFCGRDLHKPINRR